jgi:hypothetical protein
MVLRMLKVIEVVCSVDRKPLAFLYMAMYVLQVVETERYIDWLPLDFVRGAARVKSIKDCKGCQSRSP